MLKQILESEVKNISEGDVYKDLSKAYDLVEKVQGNTKLFQERFGKLLTDLDALIMDCANAGEK
jgi:Cdc6-like AAA superfamily ATPase